MRQSTPAQQAVAESKFTKSKLKAEASASSMAEHEKLMKQQRSNIERLKALRLARDAALATEAANAPAEPAKPAVRRRKSEPKP
jgi:hypothetical protein